MTATDALAPPAAPTTPGAGLVFALHVGDDGVPRPLDADGLGARRERGFVWAHVNLENRRVRDWLQAGTLPGYAKALFADPHDHTRLVTMDDGFAGVLADLRHWLAGGERRVATLRFFASPSLVVTGRTEPLQSLSLIRAQIERDGLQGGPVGLMALILRGLAGSLDALADALDGEITRLEAQAQGGNLAMAPGPEISRVRTIARSARRHISLKRHHVLQLCTTPPAWLAAADVVTMRGALDHLVAVAEDLEAVEDRAGMLQEDINGRIAQATGRNLYLISLVAALFMPMTLVTGVFGMNVAGLPWLDDPLGFVWTMAVIVGCGVASIIVLRLLKLL